MSARLATLAALAAVVLGAACAPPRAEDDGPACARLATGERVTMPLWAIELPAVRVPDAECSGADR